MTAADAMNTVLGRARLIQEPSTDSTSKADLWPGREPQVLDAGEAVVHIPLIGLTAPDVDKVVVTGTLASTEGIEAGLSFKVFGFKVGHDYKLTTEGSLKATCPAGATVRVDVVVPVRWRLMAPPDTTDERLWVEVEPQDHSAPHDIVVRQAAVADRLSAARRYEAQAGAGSLQLHESSAYTAGEEYSLSLDLKSVGVGLEMSLKRTVSHVLTFEADLQPGHAYTAALYRGVAGGVLTVEATH